MPHMPSVHPYSHSLLSRCPQYLAPRGPKKSQSRYASRKLESHGGVCEARSFKSRAAFLRTVPTVTHAPTNTYANTPTTTPAPPPPETTLPP
eukprot:17057_3